MKRDKGRTSLLTAGGAQTHDEGLTSPPAKHLSVLERPRHVVDVRALNRVPEENRKPSHGRPVGGRKAPRLQVKELSQREQPTAPPPAQSPLPPGATSVLSDKGPNEKQ